MTREQFAALPQAQRAGVRKVIERWGLDPEEAIQKATPPSMLDPFVGIWVSDGTLFIGVEPCGLAHT